MEGGTDCGRPERKQPSLHGRKFNPNPKFLDTAEAYFVCHIGPIFQISLIYAFIGCPQSVGQTLPKYYLSGFSCLFERKKSENARFFYNKDQGSPLREIIVFSTTAAAVFLTMGSKTSCLLKQRVNYPLSCFYGFKDYLCTAQPDQGENLCKKPKMLS